MTDSKRKRQAKVLRGFRKVHRITGAFLFAVFFFIAVTGLLLGWKKHSGGYILADTQKGQSTDPSLWLPVSELNKAADRVVRDQISAEMSLTLDRIDFRPDKGIVKFIYVEGYWGVQLDAKTAELLLIERRRADFIEHLHDASMFDMAFDTQFGQIKLIYTTVAGLALLTFTITGFWLWYGPKRMRAS